MAWFGPYQGIHLASSSMIRSLAGSPRVRIVKSSAQVQEPGGLPILGGFAAISEHIWKT